MIYEFIKLLKDRILGREPLPGEENYSDRDMEETGI
jgi:hypothetical protein